MFERCGAVARHQDSLARGETVSLHHVGGTEVVEHRASVRDRGDARGAPGGNVRCVHDPLGKRLGSLELCRVLVRAEHRHARGAERIRYASDERCLGADDHKVKAALAHKLRNGRGIGERQCGSFHSTRRNTGVARRADNLVVGLLREEGKNDGVFAGTGPQDEDLHGHKPTGGEPTFGTQIGWDRGEATDLRGGRPRSIVSGAGAERTACRASDGGALPP